MTNKLRWLAPSALPPAVVVICLLMLPATGCQDTGFDGSNEAINESDRLSKNGVDGADGALNNDNDADALGGGDRDTDEDGDSQNDGDDGGIDSGDDDRDGNVNDDGDEAWDEDTADLEEFLRDCGSFNGERSLNLTMPGGPDDDIDIRDYDVGGEIRKGNDGQDTYIFHLTYYRLKDMDEDKPRFVRDIHDPDYDKVYYRGLIDLPEGGFNLTADKDDCKVRAFELTQTDAENRWEFRDNHSGGCFAGSTKITLADGSQKEIAKFDGSELLRNPITGASTKISRMIKGPEKSKGLIAITVGKKVVEVTTMHPFVTLNGLVAAKDVVIGDKIISRGDKLEAVTKVEQRPVDPTTIVYNISLQAVDQSLRSHMIEANGIATGDFFLQQKLEQNSGDQKLAEGKQAN